MSTTLLPACGRDFKTVKAARASWAAGQDWIICDLFLFFYGNAANREQSGDNVTLRFCNKTKTCLPK